MRRIFIILFSLVLVISCIGQEKIQSPKTIAWTAPVEGFADSYEIAIQKNGIGTIIPIGSQVTLTKLVDLQALGLYGRYVVLVRSVSVTEADLIDYSEWSRSDINADVLTVSGVAKTFILESKKPAGKPTGIRVNP